MVVGVLALRGTLSSKKPPHSPTPSRSAALRSPAAPVLLIKIVQAPCYVFVKNTVTDIVLQDNKAPLQRGTTLQYSVVPLAVKIMDPKCAKVYVHGHLRPADTAHKAWIFIVQT